MIIKPKIKGFMCVTAHPKGCEANVKEQIQVARDTGMSGGARRSLVIGASTGYGLASRVTTAFGCGADTLGIFLERGPDMERPATAGWYNSVAFQKAARKEGMYAGSINGDAFSDEVKAQAVALLKKEMGPVDEVIYSLASPRRTHPRTGVTHRSVLKPIGETYHGKTLKTDKRIVTDVTLEPASPEEITDTIAVMGGEDWEMWIDALIKEDLLAPGCKTVAYTYIGPRLTWPMYWEGTIGRAKDDLDRATRALSDRMAAVGGSADISVMKAVVTQSSSAIPVVPLYISLLFRLMKEKGGHEGCIEQVCRLFSTCLYGDGGAAERDEVGRLRLDDLEMRAEIQDLVDANWPRINTENLDEITDFAEYQSEFLRLFGFGLDGVNYEADVDPVNGYSLD